MRQVLNSEHFNTIHVITDRSFQRPTASQCTSKPPHLLTEQGKITKKKEKKFKSKNFGRKRNGEGGDQRMEKTLLRSADVSIKLDMPKWKKPPEGKYRMIIPIASKLSPNSRLLIKCSAFWNDIMQSGAFKKKKYVLNFYNFFFHFTLHLHTV